MRPAPNQITATLEQFTTNITSGIINAISRPAVSETPVSSVFTASKRVVSSGSRTKARTTRTPMICSRSTRLTPSMRACIDRNVGTSRRMRKNISTTSTGRLTRSRAESPASWRRAITMPPRAISGAWMAIVHTMTVSIWTCCTSLVMRLINEAEPFSLTSRWEKAVTRWNSSLRTSRPKPIAVRAATQMAPAWNTVCTRATPTITAPIRQM